MYTITSKCRCIDMLNILNIKTTDEISTEETHSYISYSMKQCLSKTKCKIDEYYSSWDTFKAFTNKYEYIHTNVPETKLSVSKIRPISRAFFKLIEIFKLIELKYDHNIKTFHLAEGPGGFIEATSFYRGNKNDKYYAMTLISGDNSIPGWEKGGDFIKKNPNVNILYGADNTGNLYSVENYKYCINNFINSMDIITADGGFDFSINFNMQETRATRLILTEIIYAITMQQKGGTFILKIFDIYNKATIDLIYILSNIYNNVSIIKPKTSRVANSEKYVICQGFILDDSSIYINKFTRMLQYLNLNYRPWEQ